MIDVISRAAYTGKIGNGKIFIAEFQQIIRICTGETDEAGLERHALFVDKDE